VRDGFTINMGAVMDKYLQNLIASGADPVLIAKLSQESPNMPEPSPTVTEPGQATHSTEPAPAPRRRKTRKGD